MTSAPHRPDPRNSKQKPGRAGLRTREAGFEDIGHIGGLLREIMREHGVEPPPPVRLEEVIRRILEQPGHSFLLLEAEGVVAAMCALVLNWSTWRAALVGELQDVVVSAPYRGRGYGRRLLEEAERNASEKGAALLYLSAESWNLPAHAFYRSLGLREKTSLYFERDLTPGS